MAPADTPRRKARESNYLHIGVQGRKTGITLKDTGIRDEHGLEVIDGIFSSPEKPSPKKRGITNNVTITSEEDMDIGQSTIPEPTEVLTEQRLSRTSKTLLPPPRSRSPIKTSLNSPARRQTSMGPVSSPLKLPNGTPNRASSHPAVNRRLDFSMSDVRPSVENTPSTSIKRSQQETRQHDIASPMRDYGNGRKRLSGGSNVKFQPSPGKGKKRGLVQTMRLEESEDDDDEEDFNQVNEVTNGAHEYDEEPTALQDGEDSTQIQQMDEEQSLLPSSIKKSQLEPSDEVAQPQPRKGHGRPKKVINSEPTAPKAAAASAPALKRGRGKVQPAKAVEARGSDEDGDVEDDVTNRRPAKRLRGILAEPPAQASKAKPPKPPPTQRDPKAKITSTKDKPAETSKASKVSTESKEKPKEKPRKAPNVVRKSAKRKSSVAESRATPLEGDGLKTTRSGRTLFKPLAFWRNEHVVYGRDDSEIPTIKEIVWKDPLDEPQQKPRHKKSKKPVRKPEPEGLDEEELEEWEVEEGIVSGPVKQWDGTTGLEQEGDEVREEDLAFSSLSIETREVANATFRYQKLLTLPFFGSGMVDLPPAGVKKQKNSRKMQMVFFVFYGRVQVTVGDTEFRISQGGVWQVPRGQSLFSHRSSPFQEIYPLLLAIS
ncbi:MAG: hypothetical protein M1835_002768 [Candelina submexicana]|nr:MAG: hypothetical protein M1835_002768 [Candelina submexicana]